MKIRKVLMFLLLVLFVSGNGLTAFGETINPSDYWVLEDGYSALFSSGKTLTVTETSGGNRFKVNFMWTGTWTLGYDASGNLLMYGATMSEGGHFDVVNPQNAVLFPPEMVVGETRNISWQREEYDSAGTFHGRGSSSVAVTVSAETVTVPAGTYTAYKFDYADTWSDSWGGSGTSRSTFWLAEGIGWVKVIRSGVTYELQESEEGPPSAPRLSVSTSGVTLSLAWPALGNADGYTLFYAPYPYQGPETIGRIDRGLQAGGTFNLFEGAAYYLAVQAYNDFGDSPYSNVEYFIIGYSLSVSPGSLSISEGQTGSCTLSGGTGPYGAASSNTSVATVSVSGSTLYVTGVSAGSATITVWDSGGDSGTVSVTVAGSACSGYAGTWKGTATGRYCNDVKEDGPWQMVLNSDCSARVTTIGGTASTKMNLQGTAFTLQAVQDPHCGTINERGTFQGTRVEGSYDYSRGGGGSFSGTKR